MAYKKIIRLNLRCPKHTHYNPESGHGSIKGGCCFCEDLYILYGDVLRVEREQLKFNDETNKFVESMNMKRESKHGTI